MVNAAKGNPNAIRIQVVGDNGPVRFREFGLSNTHCKRWIGESIPEEIMDMFHCCVNARDFYGDCDESEIIVTAVPQQVRIQHILERAAGCRVIVEFADGRIYVR